MNNNAKLVASYTNCPKHGMVLDTCVQCIEVHGMLVERARVLAIVDMWIDAADKIQGATGEWQRLIYLRAAIEGETEEDKEAT